MNCTITYCGKCGGVKYSDIEMDKFTICCKCKEELTHNFQSWECQRCHKIHSPFSLQCDCPPSIRTQTSKDTQLIYGNNSLEKHT